MNENGPDLDHDRPIDRLAELLSDRALQGLTEPEAAELLRLEPGFEAESLAIEAVVAQTYLGLDVNESAELPALLRDRLERSANAYLTPSVQPFLVRSRVLPWLGWVAAAALLVFTVQARRPGNAVVPDRPREPTLVERLSGLPHVLFSATDHPLAKGAGGDLVWSADRQEGYLSLRGLAEVDPSRGVYQLWIFDSTRDDRFPVDGGTFAILDSRSPTLVPIHPSLPVRRPTFFAVTLEPPGGVVVSDRKRLLLTATPEIR